MNVRPWMYDYCYEKVNDRELINMTGAWDKEKKAPFIQRVYKKQVPRTSS